MLDVVSKANVCWLVAGVLDPVNTPTYAMAATTPYSPRAAACRMFMVLLLFNCESAITESAVGKEEVKRAKSNLKLPL
jgi:hypothetical protein